MLDLVVAYNRYKFIGYEFLTWLWHRIDTQVNEADGPDSYIFQMGNRIVLENRSREGLETITIKGDDAGFEEAFIALRKGAEVSEANLTYSHANLKWRFTIKAESLSISSLSFPETEIVETKDDLESAALNRIYLCEQVISKIEKLFQEFIKQRISDTWETKIRLQISRWMDR